MTSSSVIFQLLVRILTRDSELRSTGSGTPVCSLRLASNTRRRDAGGGWVELLLVAATVESPAYLRGLLRALGADEHLLVRLEAEPATLRSRVVEREPEGWSGLAKLIGASQELDGRIARLDGVHLALSTEGQRPEAVAAQMRAALPAKLFRNPPHEP